MATHSTQKHCTIEARLSFHGWRGWHARLLYVQTISDWASLIYSHIYISALWALLLYYIIGNLHICWRKLAVNCIQSSIQLPDWVWEAVSFSFNNYMQYTKHINIWYSQLYSMATITAIQLYENLGRIENKHPMNMNSIWQQSWYIQYYINSSRHTATKAVNMANTVGELRIAIILYIKETELLLQYYCIFTTVTYIKMYVRMHVH